MCNFFLLKVRKQSISHASTCPLLAQTVRINIASDNHNKAEPCLNIKTVFSRYKDLHVKDKTVTRPSYR